MMIARVNLCNVVGSVVNLILVRINEIKRRTRLANNQHWAHAHRNTHCFITMPCADRRRPLFEVCLLARRRRTHFLAVQTPRVVVPPLRACVRAPLRRRRVFVCASTRARVQMRTSLYGRDSCAWAVRVARLCVDTMSDRPERRRDRPSSAHIVCVYLCKCFNALGLDHIQYTVWCGGAFRAAAAAVGLFTIH